VALEGLGALLHNLHLVQRSRHLRWRLVYAALSEI
jgi:hypothetical protein